MQDFRKLRVWHLAHEVADEIYTLTSGFPVSQRNGLTDQLRRAADSVTYNLAEGCGRATKREKSHFFHIALGSVNEVDNGLLRAFRIRLIPAPAYDPLSLKVIDVRKMLVSLIAKVEGA